MCTHCKDRHMTRREARVVTQPKIRTWRIIAVLAVAALGVWAAAKIGIIDGIGVLWAGRGDITVAFAATLVVVCTVVGFIPVARRAAQVVRTVIAARQPIVQLPGPFELPAGSPPLVLPAGDSIPAAVSTDHQPVGEPVYAMTG